MFSFIMNDTDFFDETLMALFTFLLAFVDAIMLQRDEGHHGLGNCCPVIVRTSASWLSCLLFIGGIRLKMR